MIYLDNAILLLVKAVGCLSVCFTFIVMAWFYLFAKQEELKKIEKESLKKVDELLKEKKKELFVCCNRECIGNLEGFCINFSYCKSVERCTTRREYIEMNNLRSINNAIRETKPEEKNGSIYCSDTRNCFCDYVVDDKEGNRICNHYEAREGECPL